MKVTFLRLKNFVAIDATLNLKKIEIDFTKMKHSILLFIGVNGSCKTYILSQIHPFAYMGNVDVRHGMDMIIDGKDGEKEIGFINDQGDTYYIHHFYLYKKSGRQVRSYIEKNGVELNKSGLVTTFNQIVEIEFGIDIGFLRVIRLGSNVNNLVSSKSTDRKDLAVKLLTEVDEYLHDYKESTQKARAINTELKLTVEKLKRFGSDDAEETYTTRLQTLESKLKNVRQEKETSIEKLAKLKGSIESSIQGSVSDLRNQVAKIQQSKTEVERRLSVIITALQNLPSVFVTTSTLDQLIEELEDGVQETEKELSSVTTHIEVLSKTLNDQRNDLLDLTNQVKAMHEIDDSESIASDLKDAEKFDEQYKKYYETFQPTCDKKDIMEDIALAQTIADKIKDLQEFSKKSREIYYKAYSKGRDPYNYCREKLIDLRTELSLCKVTRKTEEKKLYPPSECQLYKQCAFYKALEVKDFRDSEDIKHDAELVEGAIKVADGIHNITILLSTRSKTLPIKMDIKNIILDILNHTSNFYNFEEAQHMVTFLEKYNEWKQNKERMKQLQFQLHEYELRKDSVDSGIVNQQKTLMVRISDGEKELRKLHKKKKRLAEELNFDKEKIVDANRYRELIQQRDTTTQELQSINDEVTSLEGKILLLKKFDEESFSHQQLIQQAESSIQLLEQSIFDTKVKLREFRELQEKKQKLEQSYAKIGLVRRAVSSTEGIPLLYLNLHFSRARNLANSIISSVYGDVIRLEKIIINEKEFRIPYSKNGVEVEDVIYASQGETSVISLALSFALMEEFSGRSGYNILLLDEVDGPLDRSSKEKFLRVLESQMTRIGCEQVFMITHNQLFENYPVDVFVTLDRDHQIDSYKEINQIN